MTAAPAQDIELVIIRHGQTPGNALRRYVGCKDDQPLSDIGREQALKAARAFEGLGFPEVERVYVSNLVRTHETAAILFPNAEQVVVPEIEEMDFGVFTGRSADEMEEDADYRAWVDGMCEGRCPGGESKADFDARVRKGMTAFLEGVASRGERAAYMVAHGGTLMAFLSAYADSTKTYYEWLVGNCQGYRMSVGFSDGVVHLESIEQLPAES